jgi:peptide/nickel transport system substrate-binding protein
MDRLREQARGVKPSRLARIVKSNVGLGPVGLLAPAFWIILVLAVAGCGSVSTSTTSAATSTTTGGGVNRGGLVKVGTQPATILDPHFATAVADIMLDAQVYEQLVFIDENNQAVPRLATTWSSPDGKVWTFEIRQGVKFHNGSDMTVDDVVYSFNRLRDAKVGAPTVSLYQNIADVKATDATHVVFTLAEANPEFPSDVGDYHAAIISKDVADPKKEWVGTGPFKVDSYLAEDRAILKRNPSYWDKGVDGQPLPYLDEVDFIFSPDLSAQVEALRGGDLNFVPGLSSELAGIVGGDTKLTLLKNFSNMHWVIHMRSDAGHVASDNRIRQALKLATDHQAIIDAVRPGLAAVGNDTPVGPMFKDYYLDSPPKIDLEKAKSLLAEAGYANGLKITLFAQNYLEVPAIATVWKEQMAKIGVTVDIQTIPSDVYYGEGDQGWLNVDFGITDWGSRATAVTYFKVAYTSGALYNESHWTDSEFDALTKQIDSELDGTKRAQLYRQAQQVLIDRGPVIVPFVQEAAAGLSAGITGVVVPSDWARTQFRAAQFTR